MTAFILTLLLGMSDGAGFENPNYGIGAGVRIPWEQGVTNVWATYEDAEKLETGDGTRIGAGIESIYLFGQSRTWGISTGASINYLRTSEFNKRSVRMIFGGHRQGRFNRISLRGFVPLEGDEPDVWKVETEFVTTLSSMRRYFNAKWLVALRAGYFWYDQNGDQDGTALRLELRRKF